MRETTPLLEAVENQRYDAVKLLLELGADPNKPYKPGCMVLPYAVYKNDLNIVSLLLKNKADPNCMNFTSPILMAIWKNNIDMVKMLLEAGASINYCSCSGYLIKYSLNSKEIFEYLVEKHLDMPSDRKWLQNLLCENFESDRVRDLIHRPDFPKIARNLKCNQAIRYFKERGDHKTVNILKLV